MKKSIIIFSVIAFIAGGCGQATKKQNKVDDTEDEVEIVAAFESGKLESEESQVETDLTQDDVEFKKYIANGMFIKGKVRLLDINLNSIGKLAIDEITPVQILEKSTKIYNIEDNTEDCERAYLLKVRYRGNDYTVFGQDIYEINNNMKFSVVNEQDETLTLFPIKQLKIGASHDDGGWFLTGCSDYSLLVLQNETKNQYSLMKYPENDNEIRNPLKYAVLFSDEGVGEKIYKLSIRQDTLIVGIKALYQESGSVYNLKAKLSSDLPKTKISDRIDFEWKDIEKMNEIK